MENQKEEKQKVTLAIGSFAAKTKKFFLMKFENSPDRVLFATEVEFTEGPNVGLNGTCLTSQADMEFFHNVLIAVGWTEGTNPTDIKPGIAVQAVVAEDTNPKTGETKVIVKYINPIGGRKSVLAEKFGLDKAATDQWNKQFRMLSSNFIKQSGFVVPKTPSQPQQQTQPQQPEQGKGGDDIPF